MQVSTPSLGSGSCEGLEMLAGVWPGRLHRGCRDPCEHRAWAAGLCLYLPPQPPQSSGGADRRDHSGCYARPRGATLTGNREAFPPQPECRWGAVRGLSLHKG